VLKRLLLTMLLMGCSKPPPPGPLLSFEAADKQANHNQPVTLDGYPHLPRMGLVNDTMLIPLHESTDPKSRYINISFQVGQGTNQVEKPPKSYQASDLKIHASDGSVIGDGDKIRLSGTLNWVPGTKGEHTVWVTNLTEVKKL
jgi:hypothetical protein